MCISCLLCFFELLLLQLTLVVLLVELNDGLIRLEIAEALALPLQLSQVSQNYVALTLNNMVIIRVLVQHREKLVEKVNDLLKLSSEFSILDIQIGYHLYVLFLQRFVSIVLIVSVLCNHRHIVDISLAPQENKDLLNFRFYYLVFLIVTRLIFKKRF